MNFDRISKDDHLAVQTISDHTSSRRYWRWAIGCVALIGLGYGSFMMWQVYQETTFFKDSSNQDVPIIKAQQTPYKRRPVDPGGKEIPYQDIMVLEQVLKNQVDKNTKVERLLPEPEQLLPKPRPFVDKELDKFKDKSTITDTKENIETKKDQAPPIKPTDQVNKKTEITMDQLLTDLSQPIDKTKTPSRYRIQLTSLKEPTSVEQEWQRLKQNHSDLLKGYQHQIVKVDLGEKGIYYRLMVVDFQSLEEAQALSSKLSKRNVQNILIKK